MIGTENFRRYHEFNRDLLSFTKEIPAGTYRLFGLGKAFVNLSNDAFWFVNILNPTTQEAWVETYYQSGGVNRFSTNVDVEGEYHDLLGRPDAPGDRCLRDDDGVHEGGHV